MESSRYLVSSSIFPPLVSSEYYCEDPIQPILPICKSNWPVEKLEIHRFMRCYSVLRLLKIDMKIVWCGFTGRARFPRYPSHKEFLPENRSALRDYAILRKQQDFVFSVQLVKLMFQLDGVDRSSTSYS